MQAATVMGDHIHASTLRPDRIVATGVIEPYPIQQFDPLTVARQVLQPWLSMVPSTVGPQVPTDPSPEEFVWQVQQYANAARQGIKPPDWLSTPALQAISALLRGATFTVKAQGRTLLVKPTQATTVDGPGGTSLPDVPIRTIGPASMPHVGQSPSMGPRELIDIAAIPGRRQARERQVYYLSVR